MLGQTVHLVGKGVEADRLGPDIPYSNLLKIKITSFQQSRNTG